MSLAGKRKEIEPIAPPEILLAFFELLDARSLARAAQVCREWRAIAKPLIRPGRLREGLVECVRVVSRPERERFICVAAFGNLFATASENLEIVLWSETGNRVANCAPGMYAVDMTAWKRDVLVGAAIEGCIRTWNARGEFLANMSGKNISIDAIAARDDLLVTIGRYEIGLWTEAGLQKTIHGHNLLVSLTRYGTTFATCAGDRGGLRVWADDFSGAFAVDTYRKDPGQDRCVTALASRGDLLYAVSNYGSVSAWKLEHGYLEPVWSGTQDPDGLKTRVHAIAVALGGRIATSSGGSFLRLWSEEGHEIAKLDGHRKRVFGLAATEEAIASVSIDNTMRFWGVPE